MRLQAVGRLPEFSAIMLEYHGDKAGQSIAEGLPLAGFVLTGHIFHSEHRGVLKFVREGVK